MGSCVIESFDVENECLFGILNFSLFLSRKAIFFFFFWGVPVPLRMFVLEKLILRSSVSNLV
uniref:Uncharacterized protein n=1 Tax=Rhizophora mucronata TaxID=61149 RepID=A0A2P2QVZ9_RHIMU